MNIGKTVKIHKQVPDVIVVKPKKVGTTENPGTTEGDKPIRVDNWPTKRPVRAPEKVEK